MLGVLLGLTALTTYATRAGLVRAQRARLQATAKEGLGRLDARLSAAVTLHEGAAGVLARGSSLSPKALLAFTRPRTPAREGLAWSPVVSARTHAEALAAGRAAAGDFNFWPTSEPTYPVLSVAREGAAADAATPPLGFDLGSSPPCLAVIERARDTGAPALSEPFESPWEPSSGRAVLVVTPVFRGLSDTADHRRSSLLGVLSTGFRLAPLVRDAFRASEDSIDVEVLDEVHEGGQVLFSVASSDRLPEVSQLTEVYTFLGRTWVFRFFPRRAFVEGWERTTLPIVVAVGVVTSIAIAVLAAWQQRARRAAEASAREIAAALEEVERQRALLDLVVAQSRDGIMMADRQGVLRLFNPAAAELHGLPRAATAEDWRLVHWASLDGTPLSLEDTPLYRAINGDEVRDGRWLVQGPDGTRRSLGGTATPLRGPDGRPAGGVLIVRDESDRLRGERDREYLISALEHTNAELEQFASVASHDLKAPLRGVSQLAKWLEEDLGPSLSVEQRHNIELLQGRVRRLGALVDGILSYARAGASPMPLVSVDVRALLAEVVTLLAPPPGAQVTLPSACPPLFTERVQLQQVFLNLVGNALKHGGAPRAMVSIRAVAAAGFVEFSVEDNGPGIPSADQDRVWEMFHTLASKDKKETSGIGLAVVRKLVLAHGGRVWLDSAPGRGATFSFTWPERPLSELGDLGRGGAGEAVRHAL